MGCFDSIADVLAIALSDVCDDFSVVVSDCSRVRSIGSLLGATVVHLVRPINADNHTEICRVLIITHFALISQCLVALQAYTHTR